MSDYPRLFSELTLGPRTLKNRVVFAPTYSSWTDGPFDGLLTEQGLDYWAERARGGVGLVIIGATTVHDSSRATVSAFPQLYDDRNIEPLARLADRVHAEGAKLAIQLYHGGLRNPPVLQQHPSADPAVNWYSLAPSEMPLGELAGSGSAKELEEDEIWSIIDGYRAATERAMQAGVDGVEFHLAHGYLPWQFLSPFYNKRTDGWGGSLENRLRFSRECLQGIGEAVGDRGFFGYRINGTSFWRNDLELSDVVEVVGALERDVQPHYVSVTVGIDHAWIHSPMWFEGGWEREYAEAIRRAVSCPVLMVGRITSPDVAEELLAEGAADAICLARQLFADAEWAVKAASGRSADIRPCVGANRCWRGSGLTLQCVYNPEIGREAFWGSGSLTPAEDPKKLVVVGGGPAGLEYARVAAARGHEVTVFEREPEVGGHVRLEAMLPTRERYGDMTRWLAEQARANGADIRSSTSLQPEDLEQVLGQLRPDHVVLATGSRWRRDGFQGWTGEPISGWEDANCVTWTDVVTRTNGPVGPALVVDDNAGAVAPLTALMLSERRAVTLVTRWPMIGMDTLPDMYFGWIRGMLYEAGVEVICDHFVDRFEGSTAHLYNTRHEGAVREVDVAQVVMVTTRTSERALERDLTERSVSWERIGDAAAPRSAFEAVFEGHRQARAA